MIVVSDTTPLRYLAVLGSLELLPRLFGTVHCPAKVIEECCHRHAPRLLREWASSPPSWLAVVEVTGIGEELRRRLDEGEAAAITLAERLQADLILIDEREGRRRAIEHGFITAGTLNILAEAGVRGWLDYEEVVGRLVVETNFRVTREIVDAAWQAVQP